MLHFVPLLYIVVFSACDKTRTALPCQHITPGTLFEARVHDTWCLPDGSVRITFNTIVEDSRCNVTDLACIWQGRTVLELIVTTSEAAKYTDTLTTDESWQGEIAIGSYTLSLTQVLPLMRDTTAVDTASYRFRMMLE